MLKPDSVMSSDPLPACLPTQKPTRNHIIQIYNKKEKPSPLPIGTVRIIRQTNKLPFYFTTFRISTSTTPP
jgi:hypothetical protein